MGRYDVQREIERLDPERDHQRIMHLSFGYDFCWDSVRALEIALYRTYCVPSISGLLDGPVNSRPHPAPLRRHVDPRRRDVRVGLRDRPRQGSPGAHELGPRSLQDRQRRFPLRALDVHLRADSLDRLSSVGGRPAATRSSATTISGAPSGSEWASTTSRRRTKPSRRGPRPTRRPSSASPRPTRRSARPRAICSPRGFHALPRRSCDTASTPCSTIR